MAKFYRTNSALHPLCYALQRSEDVLMAGVYLDLQLGTTERHSRILKALDQHWLAGQGLSDRTLIWLNDVRREEGLLEIAFVEGHSTSYSLLRGEPKAGFRREILEALQQIRTSDRLQYKEVLARAQTAAKSLPYRNPLQFVA
jgi:hypothetical protein